MIKEDKILTCEWDILVLWGAEFISR